MSNKALIVVDMLKDFIEKDGALFCGDKSREIIPFLRKRIEEVRNNGGTIIFLQDNHKDDDLEFKMFPKHCVKGTRGAEIIDELIVKENDIIISKTRYSGFYDTNLDKVLKDKKIEEVEVVGVCTSICVMDTVGDLRNRDYPVIVRKDGVADFDEEAHLFSLKRMGKIYGAKVL
jgi:nicotinamidase-related amidase